MNGHACGWLRVRRRATATELGKEVKPIAENSVASSSGVRSVRRGGRCVCIDNCEAAHLVTVALTVTVTVTVTIAVTVTATVTIAVTVTATVIVTVALIVTVTVSVAARG